MSLLSPWSIGKKDIIQDVRPIGSRDHNFVTVENLDELILWATSASRNDVDGFLFQVTYRWLLKQSRPDQDSYFLTSTNLESAAFGFAFLLITFYHYL